MSYAGEIIFPSCISDGTFVRYVTNDFDITVSALNSVPIAVTIYKKTILTEQNGEIKQFYNLQFLKKKRFKV